MLIMKSSDHLLLLNHFFDDEETLGHSNLLKPF